MIMVLPAMLYAQTPTADSNVPASPSNTQGSKESGFNSYGSYEGSNESVVPTQISYLKLLSFPLFALISPLAFPEYYVFTKEPTLSQSFKNYWHSIYFKVPLKLEILDEDNIDVKPSTDLTKTGTQLATKKTKP
jgi:hypothetical protein